MDKLFKFLKKSLQYALIFSFGFFIYFTIEMLYKGSSDYSMGILGGLSLILVGGINDCVIGEKWPIWIQMILGGVIITLLELFVGVTLNVDYHIWDYRNMWCNYRGQICLPFSIIWMALSFVAIVIQDYLNYYFFDGTKPHYYFWF